MVLLLFFILFFWGCSSDKESVIEQRVNFEKVCAGYVDLLASFSQDEGGLSLAAIYDKSGNKISDRDVNSDLVNWVELSSGKHAAFNGVGHYGSGCTASLIDTSPQDRASSPGYLITNGHCIGKKLMDKMVGLAYLENEIVTDGVFFQYFTDVQEKRVRYAAEEVVFASMRNTDVAVVRMASSLAELESKGVCSYPLAKSAPKEGEKIINIGGPLTGVVVPGLRASACLMGAKVNILEGPYVFSGSYPFRCSIVGGNSGSPLFAGSEIIALVNTAVSDSHIGEADCSLNKPCEVKGEDRVVKPENNYGQEVFWLSGCFNAEGLFQKDLAGCGIKNRFEG